MLSGFICGNINFSTFLDVNNYLFVTVLLKIKHNDIDIILEGKKLNVLFNKLK